MYRLDHAVSASAWFKADTASKEPLLLIVYLPCSLLHRPNPEQLFECFIVASEPKPSEGQWRHVT